MVGVYKPDYIAFADNSCDGNRDRVTQQRRATGRSPHKVAQWWGAARKLEGSDEPAPVDGFRRNRPPHRSLPGGIAEDSAPMPDRQPETLTAENPL